MSPKTAKQPQETSGKKKSKEKQKAESPLNDVAGTAVVGGVPNIPSARKVKTKYGSEQPPVVQTLPVSDPINNECKKYEWYRVHAGQGPGVPMYMYSSPVGSQRFGQLLGSGMGPPPIPPQQLSFSSPTSRPDWVNELTEDI